jgi:hypothetical protein
MTVVGSVQLTLRMMTMRRQGKPRSRGNKVQLSGSAPRCALAMPRRVSRAASRLREDPDSETFPRSFTDRILSKTRRKQQG